MARLRTFIAVDVGPEVRGRCVALQEKLARDAEGVKWVEPDNLHVSLLFLGEVVDREVPGLCRAVAVVAGRHEGFELAVEGVGCFPNPRRPRVVWAGVGAGAADLVAIHTDLEPPLLELGCYRREERQYTPHLTLGRLKRDPDPEPFAAALARQSRWRAGQVAVTELLVLSSELTPKGPEYTVLGRGKLSRPGRRPRAATGEQR